MEQDSDDSSINSNDSENWTAFGIRGSRRSVSFSRRSTSSLYPLQFMELEVYLAASEKALIDCIVLLQYAMLLVCICERISAMLTY